MIIRLKRNRKELIEGIVAEFRKQLSVDDHTKSMFSEPTCHKLDGYCEQLLIIADEIDKDCNFWFSLKIPSEWCEIFNIEIIDPDGWRDARKSLNQKIDAAEFLTLAKRSTIGKWRNIET